MGHRIHHTSYRFILLVIALPFILFWRWVFKGEVIFWGTPLLQFWPWRHLAKTMALTGEWPLWNPLLGNGTPLLANLQTAFFYPPNLIFFILPVEHALTLSVILHLSLGGALMFAYARQINLNSFAATISAITYMLSGYIVGRTQFVTMINALAWLPLLLLLSERIATRRGHLNTIWLGLVLAVQLLAGHAQLWYYSLWLAGAYTLYRVWQESSGSNRWAVTAHDKGSLPGAGSWLDSAIFQHLTLAISRGVVPLVLAIGLAIILAAVQILPTAELTAQSPRASGAERFFALSYSLWPWRLITLLAPDFFGNPAQDNYWGYANYWEDHAYLGTLPFLFGLIAIWRHFQPPTGRRGSDLRPYPQAGYPLTRPAKPPPVVPFFSLLIPISLILAMGWYTPVYQWVYDLIPGFSYFQAPSRLLIWYTIAMAVLAGIGGQFFKVPSTGRRWWRRVLVAGLGISIAGMAGNLVVSGRSLTFLSATTILGLLLSISIALLLYRPEDDTGSRWQWLVILFIALDLIWAASSLIPTLPAAIYDPSIASAEAIKTRAGDSRFFVAHSFEQTIKFDRYLRFQSFGQLKAEYWQELKETLIPNLGVYVNLPTANNDDPLVVGRWQKLMDLLREAGSSQQAQLLSLMNVGYLIDEPAKAIWPVIYDNGTMAIQQLPGVLPRAYFVPQALPVPSEAKALTRLISPDFDPRREVVIINEDGRLTADTSGLISADDRPDNKNPGRPADSAEAGVVSVTVHEHGAGRLTLSVDAPTAGFVVLTDTYYPGWQAVIDGRPATIWPANFAFRAVAVEVGEHEIDFSYRPRSFVIGLWISGTAILAITIIIILILKRNGP